VKNVDPSKLKTMGCILIFYMRPYAGVVAINYYIINYYYYTIASAGLMPTRLTLLHVY
jgi:hypothetical protein